MILLRAFRLPAGLVNRLSALAKATHCSESIYVANAIYHYLEDYADAQIAKDRFSNPKLRFISGKEVARLKYKYFIDF